MASSKVNNSYMEELLTCSVCLDLVSEPHTLAQCLHNYCKPCVQQLLHKQANPSPGVVCPLCRKFSSEDDIKPNHFVKELLAQHRAPDNRETVGNVACEKSEDTNRHHDIVTIEDGLEKMLPRVKEQVSHLDETIEEMEKGIQQYVKEEEGIKKSYQRSRQEVDEAANAKVEDIKIEQQRMKDDLTKEEKNQVEQVTRNRCELINKKKEVSNLRNMTLASIEHTRHVNAFSELVQGGLYEKLEEVNREKVSQQTISLNIPKLLVHQPAWNKLKTEGLIGTITNNVRQISWNGSKLIQHTGGKYFDGNFTDVFAKSMKKVLEIPLPDQCQDVLVYDDRIWVPLRDQNNILIYTEEGQLEKTIDLEGGPTCLDRTSEGAVLVSCHQKGMYELVDGKKPVLIDSGFYCDFCLCGDGFFALDYKKLQVVQLKKECGQWTKHEQIYFGKIGKTHIRDTLLVSDNQLEFFISFFTDGQIFKFNVHGEILQQYEATAGTQLYTGLCAVDSFNQLLFVEKMNQGYRTLNTVTGQWSPKYHTDLRLLNIKLPQKGIMWICHSRGVTKFTL